MRWPQPMFAQKKWIQFQALLGDIQREGGREKVACYSLPAPPEEEKRRLAFLVSGSQSAETTSS